MKVLIWSDIHLHNWPYGSTLVNGVNSRLLAGRKVMHQIADFVSTEQVDHIVFGGDLFHTHGIIDSNVLKVAYEGIAEIMEASNCYMDMLVGNHDTATKDMSTHSLHWLNSIPGVRVIDKPTHNDLENHADPFSFLPYTEDADVLKKFFADANEFCFMHQGMVNVPMASGFVVNEIMNYEMIPDHVKHVFTGHYHPFRLVGEKATVIGSVMQHTWADMGYNRGFLIFDTDTGTIRHISSHAPEFRTVNMGGCGSLGDPSHDALWIDRNMFRNDYIRVTSFDEAHIGNLRKEFLDAGALSVEFVVQTKTYKSTVVKAISGKGLNVPELVREYEKEHSVSETRRKVGKELMI